MRLLANGLQTHLDSGATTLCWCWRVVRRDGVTLGFTDHDNDLEFDSTVFEAASGFSASDARQAVGLNVDNSDIEGALQSERIDDDDLAGGLYDDARVELYRVNWADLAQRVLMRSGTIGEVTRSGHAFRAEIRGLTHTLGQTQGRTYQHTCDADLGDARCGVDLDTPERTVPGSVAGTISASKITAGGMAGFTSGWFAFGLLRWTSGENSGRSVQVKSHGVQGGIHTFQFWEPMRGEIQAGDTFDVITGCDKLLTTCADKFSNAVNFRGFPHLPGTNYVTLYPNSDDQR